MVNRANARKNLVAVLPKLKARWEQWKQCVLVKSWINCPNIFITLTHCAGSQLTYYKGFQQRLPPADVVVFCPGGAVFPVATSYPVGVWRETSR